MSSRVSIWNMLPHRSRHPTPKIATGLLEVVCKEQGRATCQLNHTTVFHACWLIIYSYEYRQPMSSHGYALAGLAPLDFGQEHNLVIKKARRRVRAGIGVCASSIVTMLCVIGSETAECSGDVHECAAGAVQYWLQYWRLAQS